MNNFQRDFKNAYDAYYNATDGSRISYAEYDRRTDEAAIAYATEVLDSTPREEIQKKWFKNYGTMNGWGWEQHFDYRVAYLLHEWDNDRNPQFHHKRVVDTGRGWHETTCSCGFGWSCDSDD